MDLISSLRWEHISNFLLIFFRFWEYANNSELIYSIHKRFLVCTICAAPYHSYYLQLACTNSNELIVLIFNMSYVQSWFLAVSLFGATIMLHALK